MIKLKIDGPFPLKNPNGFRDGIFANISGESFDVICWANGLTSKERQAWRRGTLRYGVFVQETIPFFLLYFPDIKWSMDVSLNVLADKKRGRPYQQYLSGNGNAVNLYLIDAKTNTIKGMRMIGIEWQAAERIREACEKQLAEYPSAIAVDAALGKILRTKTTEEMMRGCEMISP